MFKFCSLYSGSTGNSLFVETPNTKILIDAGESAKKIVSALSNICVDIENIDAILVTHEHSDHIAGIGVFCRKYGIPIFATKGTIKAILKNGGKNAPDESLFHEIEADKRIIIKDLTVSPMRISHDAAEPVAYRIGYGGKRWQSARISAFITITRWNA